MTENPQKPPRNAGIFGQGLLLGLVLGSVAGLWYAPTSGAKLIDWLQMRARQSAARAKDRLTTDSVDAALEEGRQTAQQHRTAAARRLSS
ncbi:MAG: hypothetical protein ACLFTK_06615 [Anaerolineales bacterium]